MKKVEHATIVRILLCQHLSRNEQKSNVCITTILFKKCIRLFCNCLVYFNLLYYNSIWGFRTKTALQPLCNMQKKVIRDLADVSLYEPSRQIFKDFLILVVDTINIYVMALFVNKLICAATMNFGDL